MDDQEKEKEKKEKTLINEINIWFDVCVQLIWAIRGFGYGRKKHQKKVKNKREKNDVCAIDDDILVTFS